MATGQWDRGRTSRWKESMRTVVVTLLAFLLQGRLAAIVSNIQNQGKEK